MTTTHIAIVTPMDTIQIDVFLTLADELHFGRAADRLRLPQPRVSRLVAALERHVGGKLFDRTTRKVRLTPLGEQLRDELQPGYRQVQQALSRARTTARGTDGRLRISCTATTSCAALLRLAEVFGARHPTCEVVLDDVAIEDPYTPLRRGQIDVLVNWLAVAEPDLTAGPAIDYRRRVLVVGRGHRLAGRDQVSVEDLGDEEVVQHTDARCPAGLYDAIVPPRTPSGRPIRRTYPWRSGEECIKLIAQGRIVHPTMAGVAMFRRPDLVIIPIRDLPPMPLGLIWCTTHENARIRALAETARAMRKSASLLERTNPGQAPRA